MVNVSVGVKMFYKGTYDLEPTANITTLAGCDQACLGNPLCVQRTFSIRPQNPCVLYTAITRTAAVVPATTAAVKCSCGQTNADVCGHFSSNPATAPCALFRAIDMTVAAIADPNSTQLMLFGRALPPFDGGKRPPQRLPTATGTHMSHPTEAQTVVRLVMTTEFPYGNNVTLQVSQIQYISRAQEYRLRRVQRFALESIAHELIGIA